MKNGVMVAAAGDTRAEVAGATVTKRRIQRRPPALTPETGAAAVEVVEAEATVAVAAVGFHAVAAEVAEAAEAALVEVVEEAAAEDLLAEGAEVDKPCLPLT